jgi:hypothetical protein
MFRDSFSRLNQTSSGILLCFLLLAGTGVLAQIPYNPTPVWSSSETGDFGTGCDLDDVNGDGWLDLAVSNGNDMALAPNYVYLNTLGQLPTSASWVSEDYLYSGHCELADIDGDGHPELMVANYISPGWLPGSLQVYDNTAGVLAASPTWQTADPVYSFRATFGDPDGDGDLDLAVATGESYGGEFRPNLIYFNNGGALETSPGWISGDSDAAYDAQFVDIDNDGDQDLALLTSQGPVKIYYNSDGVIDPLPGWQSALADNGNTFDFADLNGDGWLDLGVANNAQLSGTGLFNIYYSDQGQLPTEPDWASSSMGYGSSIVFADLDADGDQDMLTGRWWGQVAAYLNVGGFFETSPGWSSATSTVVENIVLGDIGNEAEEISQQVFAGDGATKLFHTGNRHLQGVDRVTVDGTDLPLTAYCYDLQAGWVSLSTAPSGQVTIHYRVSSQKDILVANWDGAAIMFGFDDVTPVPGADPLPAVTLSHRAYPNPFNPRVTIEYELPRASTVQLDVLDLRGRRVAQLVRQTQEAGRQAAIWTPRGLPSGEYFYRLQVSGHPFTGKLHLVK